MKSVIPIITTISFISHLDLQLFAEAGDVVNTTGGYVNAYNGNKENFTTSQTLDPTIKEFYDTELLENARMEMFFTQFAFKKRLPANSGRSMEFRKWNTFARAGKLQEGVIPTGQKFGMSSKMCSIDQYGTYATISDVLELHAYDPVILGATEEMGASAAETQEVLTRDALLTNPCVLYCDNINVETNAKVGDTPVNCAEMEASSSVRSILTDRMVNRAATYLKKHKVPKINGRYYAIIHPSVSEDLRNCPGWREAHVYASPEEIFLGEIGELHKVRFIEDTDAPVLGGTRYQNKAGTVTYATYFFGKDAYGVPDPEGGNLEMIVKTKEQVGGPLNQFSTVGYKFETGCVILYSERLLRVMSCSEYSDIDEATYSASAATTDTSDPDTSDPDTSDPDTSDPEE